MRLPPTPRVLFLRELVQEVQHAWPLGRIVVAVDGGARTAGFADDLATVFREAGRDTFRASLSGFHRSRAERARLGRETPESYYRDAYDYVTLRRVLLDPFRLSGSTGFQTAAFDEERDLPLVARWETAGPDALLVLDGEFLLRPELRDQWNASVLLTDAPQSSVYVADAEPQEQATYLVDDATPDAPMFVAR